MFEKEISKVFSDVGIKVDESKLESPPNEEFGDVAYPCFDLAKEQKKNPGEVAQETASKFKISKGSLIKKVEVKGPYINFFFNWPQVSKIFLKNVFKEKQIDIGKGKRVMIEFSQPNTAHGLHIGHARATMLGDSLSNIMKYAGYKIIKTNYYGDFGNQISRSIVAYLKWGKSKKVDKKPDLWMWDLYIKMHDETAKNPQLEEEAKEILRKMESGDKKIRKIWKKVRELVLEGIRETYNRLNVSFDVELYESDYYNLGKDLAKLALKKGIAQESEGAIVTNLEKFGLPNAILIKSDGTTVYQTRDIGLAVKNFKEYRLDSRIYVVDVRQSLHFKQVFKLLELLGYPWSKNLHHLGFGFVNLPEGLMASRTGRVVILDQFLDELRDLALKEVEKHNLKLAEKKKLELAEKIGKGALIFALLRIEPEQNITFNKQDIVQFEGDTGPYVQYAHTRCLGILRKAKSYKKVFYLNKMNEHEERLLKTIMKFNSVIENSAKDMRPHYICNYAYQLATVFSNFYQTTPVLKADDRKTKNFRLTLVDATKEVLSKSLKLIGMQLPEKM